MLNQVKITSLQQDSYISFFTNPKRIVFFAISLIVFTAFSQINLSKNTLSQKTIDRIIQKDNMATLEKENIKTGQHLALAEETFWVLPS
jgi:hypothetical protein